VDSVESLIASLNDRGLRESELKQSLLDNKEKIIENINKNSSISNLIIKNITKLIDVNFFLIFNLLFYLKLKI
jgi:hypothetical protein